MTVRPSREDMLARLDGAPWFVKHALVEAHQLVGDVEVRTVLASGVVETTRTAHAGSWIVTNPGGEQYVLDPDTFTARYRHVGGDRYRATGRCRAIRNPYRDDLTIDAAWGEQSGDADCWIAVQPGDPHHPYLIGGDEFAATYRKDTP